MTRARAGQARLLTSHVPIRFCSQTIERVKAIAEQSGLTVSAWIRWVVEREVERHMPVRDALSCPHATVAGMTSVTCEICGSLK